MELCKPISDSWVGWNYRFDPISETILDETEDFIWDEIYLKIKPIIEDQLIDLIEDQIYEDN